MSLNKLSISYRCLNAIGNSLDLEKMMREVIKTFVLESEAIHGSFCILHHNTCSKLINIGKKIDIDLYLIKDKFQNSEILVEEYNSNISLILYKLDNSCMVFAYEKGYDLDFIVSIFESFKNKLNISINSCVNMQKLKEKNEELSSQKKQLEKLTQNLEYEVSRATEENISKEKQIFEQLKMAQMGELIGNIAHQWRQPLSVISTAASGMKVKKELGILKDDDFFEYAQSIVDKSIYLSNTIDEFRDYINDSHKEKEIIIQERLKMAIALVESALSLENIRVIEGHIEKEDVHFKLILGDLLQVLISVLNNAREALTLNNVEDKWIKYELYRKDYFVLITIEDNAGGIDEGIIDKIFNPYFTTKHQYHGTGIGLYSGYDIIVNRLYGRFTVKNTEHGAKFFIELPLDMSYVI